MEQRIQRFRSELQGELDGSVDMLKKGAGYLETEIAAVRK